MALDTIITCRIVGGLRGGLDCHWRSPRGNVDVGSWFDCGSLRYAVPTGLIIRRHALKNHNPLFLTRNLSGTATAVHPQPRYAMLDAATNKDAVSSIHPPRLLEMSSRIESEVSSVL
jgi:hypothetical protein